MNTRRRQTRLAGSTAFLVAVIAAICPGSAYGRDVRDPDGILKAVDGLIKEDVTAWSREKGLTYPPSAVVLRIFKAERELEIWAKNDGQEKMQLVKTIPVCAMDFGPGPKLKQGDGKTPEGFYFPGFAYGSRHYWMWMRLDKEHIDEDGEPGAGSSFKMCTEYPNALDRDRTRKAGFENTGAEICLHGNCVTAGCPSFKNRDFLPVFAFSRHHNAGKYGKLQLHIFPYRFDREPDAKKMASGYKHLKALGEERLLRLWENLREGFETFNQNPNPLKIRHGERTVRAGDKAVKERGYLFQ